MKITLTKLTATKTSPPAWHFVPMLRTLLLFLVSASLGMLVACRSGSPQNKTQPFFTSGDRDADQRASQRMAQHEQLAGSGEGAGEKNVKKSSSGEGGTADTTTKGVQAEGKKALFDRLGGEAGISNIVADFVPRVLVDPRVNWDRTGVKRGGFSVHGGKSVSWNPTPEHVAILQKHLIQFMGLATGGPARYEGKDLKSVHSDMHISNAEFDAALGDLKASLDKLQIPNREQKELLAIIESTRPEIALER